MTLFECRDWLERNGFLFAFGGLPPYAWEKDGEDNKFLVVEPVFDDGLPERAGKWKVIAEKESVNSCDSLEYYADTPKEALLMAGWT